MTDWEWEYLPDAEHVIGGLAPQLQVQIEAIANRLTDAAGVKYLGDPPAEESGVSNVQDFAEGRWIVWVVPRHWWQARALSSSRAICW